MQLEASKLVLAAVLSHMLVCGCLVLKCYSIIVDITYICMFVHYRYNLIQSIQLYFTISMSPNISNGV
jgi:hypothetical protein